MSTNTTNKRKRINIDTKVAIINAVDKQEKSNAQICRDFEIVSSTLHTILKDKDKIFQWRLHRKKEENQAGGFFSS